MEVEDIGAITTDWDNVEEIDIGVGFFLEEKAPDNVVLELVSRDRRKAVSFVDCWEGKVVVNYDSISSRFSFSVEVDRVDQLIEEVVDHGDWVVNLSEYDIEFFEDSDVVKVLDSRTSMEYLSKGDVVG